MKEAIRHLEMMYAASIFALVLKATERVITVSPRDERRDRIWNGTPYHVVRKGDGLRKLKEVLEFLND